MGTTAYDILSGFRDAFGGALGFLGSLMAIFGVVMLVIQIRSEGSGGAAIAGGIFVIAAGVIIAIVAASVGSLDIEWAR